jgi:hypothetical protein
LRGRSGHSNLAGVKLNLAQINMCGERIICHLLRSGGALAGFLDFRFRDHLIGHHADRQQDADRPGQAQFVSDTVELDHLDDPKFLLQQFFRKRNLQRNGIRNLRMQTPKMRASVAATG